jgi:beta-lactamase class D
MTMMTRRGVLAGAAAMALAPIAQAADAKTLEAVFGTRTGTFVGLDLATEAKDVAFPELAATGESPFSTFKIWNSLIAVDVGVADGPSYKIAWDQKRDPAEDWWPDGWKQDHTLQTAFKASCVWYYQELARRIGMERMKAKLSEIGYGNADTSSGIDQFWLNASLRVTPEEQVAQIARIARRQTPVSAHAIDTLRTISVYEDKDATILRAKTGGGLNGRGWLVGWIEDGSTPTYAFATLVHGTSFEDIYQPRIEITRKLLAQLGRWSA